MTGELVNAVILDAAAFDVLDTPDGEPLRRLLVKTWKHEGMAKTAAVTLAEVCRGDARTRRVEALLARKFDGHSVSVVRTDVALAKVVGKILFQARADSSMIADGHVVAIAAMEADIVTVVTADPDDIAGLAAQVPGVRIVTRSPKLQRR
jgi:hypothetical protein